MRVSPVSKYAHTQNAPRLTITRQSHKTKTATALAWQTLRILNVYTIIKKTQPVSTSNHITVILHT